MSLEIAALSLLSVGSVIFYWRLIRRLTFDDGAARSALFSHADAVFAGLLSLLFLLQVWTAVNMKEKPVISTDVIVLNSVVYLCLGIVILSFMIFRDVDPRKVFGLGWPGWKAGLGSVAVALGVICPLVLLIQQVSGRFFNADDRPQESLEFFLSHTALHDRLPFIFYAVIIAPVVEELIFRGYLFGVARRYCGFWAAAATVSLLFAAIHVHLPAFGGLFVLAMAFTVVYERAGSLWASIVMHVAFNATTLVLSLYFPNL